MLPVVALLLAVLGVASELRSPGGGGDLMAQLGMLLSFVGPVGPKVEKLGSRAELEQVLLWTRARLFGALVALSLVLVGLCILATVDEAWQPRSSDEWGVFLFLLITVSISFAPIRVAAEEPWRRLRKGMDRLTRRGTT
jgi:hypothetical protein